ncbi:MAG: hypothetical protein HUJ58_07100 [Erysipelotrichaceae bacterium]|nr:hypothetical protein [Erysipelotrichaceae bacterium]
MLYYFMSIDDILSIVVILAFLLGIIGRFFVFKKMGIKPWLALIPVAGEYAVYKKCERTWHFIFLAGIATIITGVLVFNGYTGTHPLIPSYYEKVLLLVVVLSILYIIVYMYKRISFGFGHDVGYLAGLLLLNPVFLLILAFSKDRFDEERISLKGKELRQYIKTHRSRFEKVVATLTTVVIFLGSIGYCGYISLTEHQPGFFIRMSIEAFLSSRSEYADGTHEVIYPAKNDGIQTEMRDLYFADKSDVKETVVYCYFIGSDLEDSMGLASYNLSEIIEATKQGDSLKFVIQAGGSRRWFTEGFSYNTIGRYEIKNGEVTLVQKLDDKTCMSEQSTLEDFLTWANTNYPADRKMLVLWNHGGGVMGYGLDELNDPATGIGILSVADIATSLKNSNSRFDLIDFDACLMQTLEVAYCLEPYTDYLLGSEETEPGLGQYYTLPFGQLAKDPTLSTIDFAQMMCSCYDQYLAESTEGSSNASTTLSLIETRRIPALCDALYGWIQKNMDVFTLDKDAMLAFLKANGEAYHFGATDHIDLIDFINNCDMEQADKNTLLTLAQNAVVLRNADSAEHINGISVYLPYRSVGYYDMLYPSLVAMEIPRQTEVCNIIVSILANHTADDFSSSEWFVKGYEDYKLITGTPTPTLLQTDDKYQVVLSTEQENYVVDAELDLWMKVNNRYADLGTDSHYDYYDGENYGFTFDGSWLTINGIPVATKTVSEQTNADTSTYLSTVSAVYNFVTPITIYVERTFRNDGTVETSVLGYRTVEDEETSTAKGYNPFKPGCLVTFTYDWYDEDGTYIRTAMGHLPVLIDKNGLQAAQTTFDNEEFRFCGIITDAANQVYETERVNYPDK